VFCASFGSANELNRQQTRTRAQHPPWRLRLLAVATVSIGALGGTGTLAREGEDAKGDGLGDVGDVNERGTAAAVVVVRGGTRQ
jgi:hypothetical protein